MIVSMRYVMRGVVFGHNQRSITLILGQISISLELLHVCAQMKGLDS